MKRDTESLSAQHFDLLVVGAGIYGACIARDAALRGLTVALIEKGDFSSATSHNSGKIVHGGIRYLQHLDFRRVRESVSELGVWLTIAPHLVKPLQFVVPTQGYLTRGPAALLAGLVMHRMIATGTQRNVMPGLRTAAGRIYSKSRLREMLPDLPMSGLSGAASWYDGQLVDADRIILECVQSAVGCGAVAANHVEAIDVLRSDGRIHGIAAIDRVSGSELEIRATMTVVAGGPWAGSFLNRTLGKQSANLAPALAKNMNIVVPRIFSDYGVGIPSKRESDAVVGSESRLFFVAPWKNVSIIGTTHFPYDGDPDEYQATEAEVEQFVDELNAGYPPARLSPENVLYVYSGLTPADPDSVRGEVGRSKRAEIIDHGMVDDAEGLITTIGVKYTTARLVAERVVDLVQKKNRSSTTSRDARMTRLPGGENYSPPRDAQSAPWPDPTSVSDLLAPYGSLAEAIFADTDDDYEAVFRTCVRHATENEMATTLEDALLRRVDIVERGLLTDDLLRAASEEMATALGWSPAESETQQTDFRSKVRYLSSAEAV
jgi:glycerol-3-phosphate dehydrogenase